MSIEDVMDVAVADDAEIARLAELTDIGRDRQIKTSAKELHCRVRTLRGEVERKRK